MEVTEALVLVGSLLGLYLVYRYVPEKWRDGVVLAVIAAIGYLTFRQTAIGIFQRKAGTESPPPPLDVKESISHAEEVLEELEELESAPVPDRERVADVLLGSMRRK